MTQMKISLEGLQVLDTINRRGSFAAAAEELFRTPSTITYAVQRLEEDLGFPLFKRNGHRPRLTPAGEEVLKEGRRILQAAADLEARAKRIAEGYEPSLRIALHGLLPSGPILALAREFYADSGNSDAHLSIAQETIAGAWETPPVQRADLVVGANAGNHPDHVAHHTHHIGTLEFIFVAGRGHPLATCGRPVSTQVLRSHRAAIVGGSAIFLPPNPLEPFASQKTITLPDVHTKVAAVKSGLAVGFLPRCLVSQELSQGDLVEVMLEAPLAPRRFYLAWDDRPHGNAFGWWLHQLDRPTLLEEWFGRAPARTARPERGRRNRLRDADRGAARLDADRAPDSSARDARAR